MRSESVFSMAILVKKKQNMQDFLMTESCCIYQDTSEKSYTFILHSHVDRMLIDHKHYRISVEYQRI